MPSPSQGNVPQPSLMSAIFSYGKRADAFVHIGELNPSEHSGLKCGCVCPECGLQLQAHLGAKKAWHFQHHVEEANCNPQPMTLLHAFVRDELAARRLHVVPQTISYMDVEADRKLYKTLVTVPMESFEAESAAAEVRGDGVQPDVVCRLKNGATVAIEVRFTHAVDDAKKQLLERGYAMSLEFDVSDLPPAGVTREQLNDALKESHRWLWLDGAPLRLAKARAAMRISWSNNAWRVDANVEGNPDVHPAPTSLAQAAKRLLWAKAQLRALKAQGVKGEDGARWLGQQEKVDRVAVACAALRLDPNQLPGFLLQRPPFEKWPIRALNHHGYSWQPLVFMKFGIGKAVFSAAQAGEWSVMAMPDRCDSEDGTLSRNGLTRTAARLHLYFLQLEAQGWLHGVPSSTRETRTFRPKFETVEQFLSALAT